MSNYVNEEVKVLLKANSYPGRGIITGTTADGTVSAIAYFIMGRSENSRNRVFRPTQDGIKTEACDPEKLSDPSLIIYNPVRFHEDEIIITNGDQTDTIKEALAAGESFESALLTREFEPDAPNLTPRISAIVHPDGSYEMSILKSADEVGNACARYFYNFPKVAGTGHFLHTYEGDGNPLPSFKGEPRRISISDSIDSFASEIWENLDPDNKVSLYVCYKNIETFSCRQKIINRNASL